MVLDSEVFKVTEFEFDVAYQSGHGVAPEGSYVPACCFQGGGLTT